MNRRKAIIRMSLLGGGALSTFYGIKWVRSRIPPNVSDIFSHQALVDELAETIIPATDTPGAKDAKVGAFICLMVKDCTETPSQNNFMDGLKSVEHYCHAEFKQSFMQCNAGQRQKVLSHFEKEGTLSPGKWGKIEQKIWGKPFFAILKDYTVIGYCSSKEGATKGLDYDFIPSTYQACIPYKPMQKSWATK